MDGLVPGFVLQPLVENAIMHGLEMSKGQGTIDIEAELLGNEMRIVVADNGVGMEPDRAARLLASDREKKRYPGLNGIGVRNVHERIRSVFGEPYGLSFETAPGRGMRVILTVPYTVTVSASERRDADVQDARRRG